jgi:formate-dependent nitrite reductase membrane component NrfD
MAACPYDAIYIDPNTHTLGKCNFCSHRVDLGLQPACVNICPVEAIVTGDLDNPRSRISQLLSLEPATVRRPEKGTKPKLFYLGADGSAVNPEATAERPTYMMAGSDPNKPIRVSESIGYVPAGLVQRNYSVAHARPWGWQVAAYLWTKSVAAGSFLVAAILSLLGAVSHGHTLMTLGSPVVALTFLAITNLLLVADLERPERFWRVMLWPHWSSWLVIGAYILGLYGALVLSTLFTGIVGAWGLFRALLWLGGALAVAAAGYSAFLLAQAKGRDLWQSPLLFPHLVVQAAVGGAAVLALLTAAFDRRAVLPVSVVLSVSLGLSLILILAEVNLPHVTAHTRQALRNMQQERSGLSLWLGVVGLGGIVPLGLAAWGAAGGPAAVSAVAAVFALAGLALYEELYVRAGQSVPLS